MPHYEPLHGGRLVDILREVGAERVRCVGDRVYIRHPVTEYVCGVNVLRVIPADKVGKLCKKHGITTVRFHELLKLQPARS